MASKQETTTSIMSQIMSILESDEKELFSSFNSKSVEEFSESIETNDELVKLGIIIKKILNHFLSKKEDVNEDITKFTETIIQKYNSILALRRRLAGQQLISPEEIRNLPGFTPNSTPQGPQGSPYLQSPDAAASAAAAPLSSVRQLFNPGNPETGGKKRKRRRTKKRKSKKKRKRKSKSRKMRKRRKRKSRKMRKRTKRTRRS